MKPTSLRSTIHYVITIVISAMALTTPNDTLAIPPGAEPPQTPAAKGKSGVPDEATPAEAKPQTDTQPADTAPVSKPDETSNAESPTTDQGVLAVDEEISENDPEQGAVPLKELDLGQPVESAGKKNPFFTDSKLRLGLRSFYFYRTRYDNTNAEAEALGAALSFKSGYLAERFGMGATLYTSVPLYAPSGRDGTGLLHDNQEPYAVLGQIYGEVKIVDGLQMNFGRKEYNTPYVNAHDVRMTPKTFQGVTFTGAHKGRAENSNWRYGAGYLYKMKDWDQVDFDWMSDAVGVDEERGVAMLGGNYSTDKLSIGAIDYFSPDVLNILYTEGSYGWKLSPDTSIKLSAQFADQRSTGEDLITDDSFDVQQWGVKADFGIWDATVTLGFTDTTGGSENMRSPWGGYPGYTSVQVKDFNRADESAFILKVAYDFTNLGAPGFSVYGLWVHGFNVDDPNFNEDEWDLNAQWAPKEGKMKDFSARVRYAQIHQRGDGDPIIYDFRLIFNYGFNLYPFGKR